MSWVASFGIALSVFLSSIFGGVFGFFHQAQAPATTTTQTITRGITQTTTQQVTTVENTLQNANQNAAGTFSANQTSGTAPLAVSFSYSNLDQKDTYKIDFGDTSALITMHCRTSSACDPGSISHTYTLPGVYVATLNKQNEDFSCAADVSCDPPGPTTIPLKITVGGVSSMSAIIDQSSLIPTSYGVYLTGTASNTTSLWVDAIDASYTGQTDYFSLMNSDQACGAQGFKNECFSVRVSSGRWSAQMRLGGGTGTHDVYVFDGGASHALLASGTFTLK